MYRCAYKGFNSHFVSGVATVEWTLIKMKFYFAFWVPQSVRVEMSTAELKQIHSAVV